MCLIIFEEKVEGQDQYFEPEPGSKSRLSYSGSQQKYWANTNLQYTFIFSAYLRGLMETCFHKKCDHPSSFDDLEPNFKFLEGKFLRCKQVPCTLE